ncbi:hypothetical protein [Lysinibacillus sp. NPDC086135]|uniref:hypothetical protein n=1 Tax=Lysinibacillus sp. NPDC086135 TaxID=3364130 RepID=UPI00381577EE
MTSYDLKRKENESFKDYHIRLYSNLDSYEISSDEATLLLNKEYGSNYSESKWRKDFGQYINWKDYIESKLIGDNELPSYKQSNEIKGDGTHSSDKLIRISESDKLDNKAILEAHGFDINEFDLVNAKNSIWNQSIDKTLYSSKITVKPKSVKFDIENVLSQLQDKVKKVVINKNEFKGENLLEIPLVDMHFGINDLEYYKETLNEIIELIESKKWDTIYIPIGNDLLHHDDFKGHTSNGTAIEKVDIENAWTDAFTFYSHIYEASLKNSNNVASDYVCGNHDKVMTYGLVRALEVKFPQVKFDTSVSNKKMFTWKDVAILSLHGDKGSNRISKTIYKEYGKIIADKKVVEIHSGHLHFSQSKDDFGVVFRTLPTKAKTDEWHREESFVGAGKYFSLFEYKSDLLKTIHNI